MLEVQREARAEVARERDAVGVGVGDARGVAARAGRGDPAAAAPAGARAAAAAPAAAPAPSSAVVRSARGEAASARPRARRRRAAPAVEARRRRERPQPRAQLRLRLARLRGRLLARRRVVEQPLLLHTLICARRPALIRSPVGDTDSDSGAHGFTESGASTHWDAGPSSTSTQCEKESARTVGAVLFARPTLAAPRSPARGPPDRARRASPAFDRWLTSPRPESARERSVGA